MSDIQEISTTLLGKLRSIIGPQTELDETTQLNQAGLDSVRMVELLVFIEKEFDLELLSMGLSAVDMETTGTLARFIANQMST